MWESPRDMSWSQLDRPFCIATHHAAFQQASDVIANEEEWTSRNAEAGVNLIQKHYTIKVRGQASSVSAECS